MGANNRLLSGNPFQAAGLQVRWGRSTTTLQTSWWSTRDEQGVKLLKRGRAEARERAAVDLILTLTENQTAYWSEIIQLDVDLWQLDKKGDITCWLEQQEFSDEPT